MRIEKQDSQSVTIVTSTAKATDLLDGLLAHPELGEQAATLAEALKAAGVEPSIGDVRIRHEYAPPLTH